MVNQLTNPTFANATGSGASTDWPGWTRVGFEYNAGSTLPRIGLLSTASGAHSFTSNSIGTANVGDTVTASAKARQYTSSGSGGTKCELRILAGTRVVASVEVNTDQVAFATQTISGQLVAGDNGQPITLQLMTDLHERRLIFEAPTLEVVATGPPPDTTPPSVPANLRLLSKGKNAVFIAWDASTDNAAGTVRYKVYDNGVRLSPTSTITDTSYLHSGLGEGSTHVYTVRAVDVAGNESSASASLTVTTDVVTPPPDTTPPSTPTGLAATSKTQTSITLSWSPSTDDTAVVGYHVRDGEVVVSDLVTDTTFTHSGLTAGSTHTYKVRAGDAAGNWSPDSTTVTVTTDSTPPPDPDPDPDEPSPAIQRVREFLGVPDNPALLEIL